MSIDMALGSQPYIRQELNLSKTDFSYALSAFGFMPLARCQLAGSQIDLVPDFTDELHTRVEFLCCDRWIRGIVGLALSRTSCLRLVRLERFRLFQRLLGGGSHRPKGEKQVVSSR